MSFDVAYLISHGFSARMVTQCNLLGALVTGGKTVCVICPNANDINLKSYCTQKKISLFEFKPRYKFWQDYYLNLRKYLFEDVNNNIALKEKHIWSTKYNESLNPLNHLIPRIGYLIYFLLNRYPNARKVFKLMEEKLLISNDAKKILNQINPKLLFSTYPINYTESILLKAGNLRHGTKTVIHLLSWDNITCKGFFPQLSNDFIVWGEIMKNEIKEFYNIEDKNIHICGVSHFDLHYDAISCNDTNNYLQDFGFKPDCKYLFFGMSSPRFAPYEIDIVEKISEWISTNAFGPYLNLVIRPHPQNIKGFMADTSWLPRLEKLKSDRVAIDIPTLIESDLLWSMAYDDMIRLSKLIARSSIVINSGSTISIDALCTLKPVIISSFDGHYNIEYWKSARRLIDFPHLKKLISFNGVKVSTNYYELKNHILQYLTEPCIDTLSREKTIKKYCFLSDGKSTKRIQNTIEFLLE